MVQFSHKSHRNVDPLDMLNPKNLGVATPSLLVPPWYPGDNFVMMIIKITDDNRVNDKMTNDDGDNGEMIIQCNCNQ